MGGNDKCSHKIDQNRRGEPLCSPMLCETIMGLSLTKIVQYFKNITTNEFVRQTKMIDPDTVLSRQM